MATQKANRVYLPAYRRLYHLLRRPWTEQWLAVQVFVLLGAARLAILRLPFARLQRVLGTRHVETAPDAPAAHLQQARRIAWAIHRVSRYTPWTSNCLPQAITAKLLLRQRGIASTLYLGAAFQEGSAALEAHAWLRCGSLYVTGGDGSARYGAIVAYGDEPQPR